MDHSYILPFIKSVSNVFETMLQTKVKISKPVLRQPNQPRFDVSGIIGMSGDVEGTIILSFPSPVAIACVAKFTGMEMATDDEDFADAIGELVNMVSGSAKAEFQGKKVAITCPSVVIGPNHVVFGNRDVVGINIPCETELGHFIVEIGLKQGSDVAKETLSEVSGAA